MKCSTKYAFILTLTLYIPTVQCFATSQQGSTRSQGNRRTADTLFVTRRNNGGNDNHHPAASLLPIPNHVAFVCDGNSRWAKNRGLPVIAGHTAGAVRLVNVVLPCLKERGVKYCTMYGFSTENWQRSEKEISDIFSVMERTANTVCDRLLERREIVRVRILGDLNDNRIPTTLKSALERLEQETDRICNDRNQPHTLYLAINYGGRRDILEAAKKLARAAARSGDIDAIEQLSENDFSKLLCTDGIPDPDLVIRTSGECRISNFLLWNTAYSEFYFTPVLWPDFDSEALSEALDWYASRKRRFGARHEINVTDASYIKS
ncbi:hypothetical protein ACA910_008666 [Epithemia clementina (nom. ined.)]